MLCVKMSHACAFFTGVSITFTDSQRGSKKFKDKGPGRIMKGSADSVGWRRAWVMAGKLLVPGVEV